MPDGKYKVLADKFEGKKFNSPNDVILGPDGALYFTDPTLDLVKGEKQELPYQGVFRLGTDGSVRLLTKDLVQPNGLAFSPDGKRLYIDDTKQREIRVYDVGANGELKNGRLFGKEEGRGGVPDGMRVDLAGQCLGHRAGRHLGVGSGRQPHRHDPDAGIDGQSQLGRCAIIARCISRRKRRSTGSKRKPRGFVPGK